MFHILVLVQFLFVLGCWVWRWQEWPPVVLIGVPAWQFLEVATSAVGTFLQFSTQQPRSRSWWFGDLGILFSGRDSESPCGNLWNSTAIPNHLAVQIRLESVKLKSWPIFRGQIWSNLGDHKRIEWLKGPFTGITPYFVCSSHPFL
jgi:hypothetical protein